MVRRRLRQLILALYVAATIGALGMVVGPLLNDSTIHSDPGRGMATVTGTSLFRTTVDYQDEAGRYHSPQQGLLYPSGLGEGQQVWVTYAKSNPDLVKVEGRKWTLSIIPALSVWVVATLLAGLSWWAVGASQRNKDKREAKVHL